jgi:hypothetical protein
MLEPTHSLAILSSDGVPLATDVYLPTSPTKHGTVLVRLPYGRRGQIAFLPGLAELLCGRGWALVTQDVRGKFDSLGDQNPFVFEMGDSYQTLEWITRQSWSDGRVVPAGDSYFGYTAWAAAASGHHSVKGLMVRVTSPTITRDWMSRGGIFLLGNMTEWAASTWMEAGWVDANLNWKIMPSSNILSSAFGGRRNNYYESWAKDVNGMSWGAVDADLRRAVQKPAVIAHVGGWWDIFQRGQIKTWRDARSFNSGNVQPLIMDATDHVLDPFLPPGVKGIDVVADISLRRARLSTEWQQLLDVMDHLDNREFLTSSVRWRPGLGDWRESSDWPPVEARILSLFLVNGQHATQSPEGGDLAFKRVGGGKVTWIHDPELPVPTMEKDLWRPLLSSSDHSNIHERPDVATFTSVPFKTGITLAGNAFLNIKVGTSCGSGHLMATLCHLWPDATATPIGEGAVAFSDAINGELVNVDLGNLGYQLPHGHQLRLAVTSSSYPRYTIHPGNAESPFYAERRFPMDVWIQPDDDTHLTIMVVE